MITQHIVKRFCNGDKPGDASEISHELEIPVRLVRQLLFELSESGVLSETRTDQDKEPAYQPAIDIDKMTVKFVIDRQRERGTSTIPVSKSAEFDKLTDCLKQFSETIDKSPANVLLKNL